MKLFSKLFLIIIGVIQSNAQNPFQSIGKEATVLTLSNGQYKEFHPNDSLRQIGSVIVNMRTGKIQELLVTTDPSGEINQERITVSRWFSVDPLAKKYPEYSPYAAFADNPIIYIDPDGRDIVYFDTKGNEVGRQYSTTEFRTFVAVDADYQVKEGQAIVHQAGVMFVEAKMPGVIQGYTDPKYQQWDHVIASQVFIFNNKERSELPLETNGNAIVGDLPPELPVDLVKAMIVKETLAGNFNGNGQNGKSDIMQANVQLSPKSTDWNDSKKQFGLVQGASADPIQSVSAGIGMLYQKGLTTDGNGQTTWTGGSDWSKAAERYNGGGDATYMTKINSHLSTMQQGKSVNYKGTSGAGGSYNKPNATIKDEGKTTR